MLRRKLTAALLLLVALFFVLGAGSVWTFRHGSRDNAQKTQEAYRAVRAAHQIRIGTSQVNTYYLPRLLQTVVPAELERTTFNENRERIAGSLAHLQGTQRGEITDDQIDRLASLVSQYEQTYDTLFQGPPPPPPAEPGQQPEPPPAPPAPGQEGAATPAEVPDPTAAWRQRMQDEIAAVTSAITESSQAVVAVFEVRLLEAQRDYRREADLGTGFVAAILAVGCVVASLIYVQLRHSLIEPLIRLSEAVSEIRSRNFEFVLPIDREDEVGRLTEGFNEMAVDLRTMLRESDEEIQRASREGRAILSAFPHPIFIVGDRGDISQLNPKAEWLVDGLGTPGRLPQKVVRVFEQAAAQGLNYMPERLEKALLFRIDEAEHFFLPRIFRIGLEEESVHGWAIVLTDVTQFRWLDDLKTNVISTVSHEIKTPLTGIRMVLHLLAEQKTGPLNGVQEEMVTSARTDCERLLDTLNRLLQVSREGSGADQLTLERLAVPPCLDDAVRRFKPMAGEHDIRLRDGTSTDVPEILADRIRIDEVLNNLIANALKHSPVGGEILVCARQLGSEYVRVSIYDDGPGVPEDEQSRIFEKFYRAPSHANGGVGLGLSICREILVAHEGRIGVNSRPDSRTEFYFDVPIA